MLCGVLGAADEEVLDVVVRPAKAEKDVRRLEGVVRCLRELSNWIDYNNESR